MSNLPPLGLFGLTITTSVVPRGTSSLARSKAKARSGSSGVSVT
jgi:hypothetical protein